MAKEFYLEHAGKTYTFTCGTTAYLGYKAMFADPNVYERMESWEPIERAEFDKLSPEERYDAVESPDGDVMVKRIKVRMRMSTDTMSRILAITGEDNHPRTDWRALDKAADPDELFRLFAELMQELGDLFRSRLAEHAKRAGKV